MAPMLLALIVAALTLPFHITSALSAEDLPEIPSDFHGTWGLGTAPCSVKDWRNRDTLHQISATGTEWWEATCLLDRAERDESGTSLKTYWRCEGEGEQRTSVELWRLFTIDGAKYLVTSAMTPGRMNIYRRCE
jgi:hypothetical protein